MCCKYVCVSKVLAACVRGPDTSHQHPSQKARHRDVCLRSRYEHPWCLLISQTRQPSAWWETSSQKLWEKYLKKTLDMKLQSTHTHTIIMFIHTHLCTHIHTNKAIYSRRTIWTDFFICYNGIVIVFTIYMTLF